MEKPKHLDLDRLYKASKFNVFNLDVPELKYKLDYENLF